MTRDEVLDFCSQQQSAVEDAPFGDEVAVFKVGGKMFALVMLGEDPGRVNLKCDPDWALELRAQHRRCSPATTPTSGTGTPSPSTEASIPKRSAR